MASLIQLEKALHGAHKAGDTAAAKKLASAIKNKEYAPVDFDIGTTVKNIPSSAKQYISDVTYPFRGIDNAVNTVQGMWRMGSGGVQKLIPGEQDNEKYADALGSFYKDRYGGADEIKSTIMNDPVGFLSDASLPITLGGLGLAKLPGTAGKIGKATQTAGKVVDPLTAAMNATRIGAGKVIPKNMPVNMMNSAVKWNTTTPLKNRNGMANTMLDNEIMPTYAGTIKADKKITQLNNKIDSIIDTATNDGGKIKIDDLWGNFEEGLKKLDSPDVPESGKMSKAYLDQIQVYLDDWARQGITELTPKQVQQFKKNLYKQISFDNLDKSAQVVSEGQDSARLHLAKNARTSIENIDPSIKDLNRSEGDLLGLMKELPRKASRIENRNSIPLSFAPQAGLGAGVDYLLGMPGVGTVAATAGTVFDMPRPKARNAITLRALQNATMTDGSLLPFLLRQGAFNTSRLEND